MIVVLLAVSSMSSFVHATCQTCNKEPQQLQKYFWVMNELITLVDIDPDPERGNGVDVAAQAALDA
jgi:hypothetical protein